MIKCLDGVKTMEIEGKPLTLKPGEDVTIKTRTFHRALNYEKALMASHGIDDTETLKRLHQNN
jgi:mannose-6-phosphate isomerase-like protein (cupin superfamily)